MTKPDEKQKRLSTEEGTKRVTFTTSTNKKKNMEELGKKIREQVRMEIKLLREERYGEFVEELRGKERKWMEKINEMDNRIREWVDWMISKLEQMEGNREKNIGRMEGEGGSRSEDGDNSVSRYIYRTYRRASSIASSGISEGRLNTKEVKVIKKMITDKGREAKKCNIVIKEEELLKEGENGKEWVERLIKEKIKIECKIVECRSSGLVLVAKVESEEKEREVMRNKNRLKGGNIFIENDLSWEERKIQEKMNSWARERRREGVEVKVGKVRVASKWKDWEEIESEIGERNSERGIRVGDRQGKE